MSHFVKIEKLVLILLLVGFNAAIGQNVSVKDTDKKDGIYLLTLKKDTVNLQFSKKFTMVSFFSIFCKPCLNELNAFQRNYQKWSKSFDINILGITSSFDYLYYNKIVKFEKKRNYDFPLFIDLNNSFTMYSYNATPSEKDKYFRLNNDVIEILRPQLFIFDSKGKIIYHKRAFLDGDEEKIFEFLSNWKE